MHSTAALFNLFQIHHGKTRFFSEGTPFGTLFSPPLPICTETLHKLLYFPQLLLTFLRAHVQPNCSLQKVPSEGECRGGGGVLPGPTCQEAADLFRDSGGAAHVELNKVGARGQLFGRGEGEGEGNVTTPPLPQLREVSERNHREKVGAGLCSTQRYCFLICPASHVRMRSTASRFLDY